MRRFLAVVMVFASPLGFQAACSDDTPAAGGDLPGDRGVATEDAATSNDAADARTDVTSDAATRDARDD